MFHCAEWAGYMNTYFTKKQKAWKYALAAESHSHSQLQNCKSKLHWNTIVHLLGWQVFKILKCQWKHKHSYITCENEEFEGNCIFSKITWMCAL